MISIKLKSPLTIARLVGAILAGACMTLLTGSALASQEGASRLNLRIIQSGHSLTDPIPAPLKAFALAAGARPGVVIDRSTIPGSPMDYRWDHEPHPPMPNARTAIAGYDVLVLTERTSLSATMPWHNSPTQALRWALHALNNGADGDGAETILYATWVEVTSGPDYENPWNDPEGHLPWRERLPLEFARWMEIADFVNANLPASARPMKVIPATLVMAAAYDDIKAGKAPGLTDIQQLFSDDIHLNKAGAYLVALSHFAVIYDLDPRGLPPAIGQEKSISADQAQWMQNLVRDVIATYESAVARRQNGPAISSEELLACLWQDLRKGSFPCA